mgnify:CR=1 FL=1
MVPAIGNSIYVRTLARTYCPIFIPQHSLQTKIVHNLSNCRLSKFSSSIYISCRYITLRVIYVGDVISLTSFLLLVLRISLTLD